MEDLPKYLLTQGALGLAALVEGLVIRSIYKELKDERHRNSVLQEARRLDAQQTTNQVTSVLPGISQSLQNISDKIEISKRR